MIEPIICLLSLLIGLLLFELIHYYEYKLNNTLIELYNQKIEILEWRNKEIESILIEIIKNGRKNGFAGSPESHETEGPGA